MDEIETESLENVYCDFVLMQFWQDLEWTQIVKAVQQIDWGY